MDVKELSYANEAAIEALLVGRRIVRAEMLPAPMQIKWRECTGVLELDDGTVVYVSPNRGGCACSAGDYDLTHLASVDNVITSVRTSEDRSDDRYGEAATYRIFVVADATEINVVTVEGDDGNGYYGTGYELFVTRP